MLSLTEGREVPLNIITRRVGTSVLASYKEKKIVRSGMGELKNEYDLIKKK